MTTRTKIGFFFVMGLALMMSAVVLVGETLGYWQRPTPGAVQTQIQVAAAPSIYDWVAAAAREFTAEQRNITVEVIELKSLDAGQTAELTDVANKVDVWIPETTFMRQMAGSLNYENDGPALAGNRLMWAASADYAALQGQLDWALVYQAAGDGNAWQTLSGGDFVFDLAFPPPRSSFEGLAALLSAAAGFHNQTALNQSLVSDPAFLAWLAEIQRAVPEPNADPAAQLARTPVSVDVGLILAHDRNRLNESRFIFQEPAYNIYLNYPYLIRTDDVVENVEARREAARTFRDFLLANRQQQRLDRFGLTPADSQSSGIQVDGNTALSIWARFR